MHEARVDLGPLTKGRPYDRPEEVEAAIPVEVAGKPLFDIVWPVYFEKPADLFPARPTGGRGPDLRVRVEQRDARRLFLTVEGAGRSLVAAVEQADSPAFVLASRGRAGRDGLDRIQRLGQQPRQRRQLGVVPGRVWRQRRRRHGRHGRRARRIGRGRRAGRAGRQRRQRHDVRRRHTSRHRRMLPALQKGSS